MSCRRASWRVGIDRCSRRRKSASHSVARRPRHQRQRPSARLPVCCRCRPSARMTLPGTVTLISRHWTPVHRGRVPSDGEFTLACQPARTRRRQQSRRCSAVPTPPKPGATTSLVSFTSPQLRPSTSSCHVQRRSDSRCPVGRCRSGSCATLTAAVVLSACSSSFRTRPAHPADIPGYLGVQANASATAAEARQTGMTPHCTRAGTAVFTVPGWQIPTEDSSQRPTLL